MKVTNVLADILIKVSKQNKIESPKALKIVESFYKGIRHTIETQKAEVIKVPYFGKFLFSPDRARIREANRIKFEELAFKKAQEEENW